MNHKKILLFAILTLFVVTTPLVAFGATFKEGDDVTIAEDEVIDGDFYTAGGDLNVEGFVKGDFFGAGATIDVDHDIGGDFFAAAGTINVKSAVWDDARIAGSQITLDADIGDDLFAAGSIIECTNDSVIGGDVFVSGSVIKMLGDVEGKMYLTGSEVIIDGTVKGNVEVWADKLTLRKDAAIAGNLEYTSDNELVKEEGAKVSGETTRHDPPTTAAWLGGIALTGAFFFWKAIWWIAGLIFLLVLLWMFPNFSVRVTHYLDEKPWKSLGVGLVTLIVAPIIAVILCITLIGLPLGIVLIGFYLFAMFVAKMYFAFWVGRKIFWLFNRNKKGYQAPLVWSAIVGTLVVTIIFMIPIVGWFVKMISLWFIFGAFLMTGRLVLLHLRKKKIA